MEDMTEMQFLLLNAHAYLANPENTQKDLENKQEGLWQQKLKEAQENSINRKKTREETIKESQEKLLKMVESNKDNK